jgi:hypothetical protein
MTPSIDERSAARILELAEQPTGSRSRAAASFCLILALAAHGASVGGSPAPAQTAAMSPAGAGPIPRESDHMKRLMAIGAAAALASGAAAQDAVQWRVEDGGNGHWYGLLPLCLNLDAFPSNPDCGTVGVQGALDIAGQRSAFLITIHSQAEHDFAHSMVASRYPYYQGFRVLTGGIRTADGYAWRNGERFTFSIFSGSAPVNPVGSPVIFGCGPNNTWCPTLSTGCWMTYPESFTDKYHVAILEWSADCNSDGLVDFGQIRAGELADANANNIPDCCEAGVDCDPCLADISGNGTVDGVDLAAVLNSWGNAPTGKSNADVNADGVVDGADLAEVLNAWGACP